jgi:hypothetical protein
MRFRSGATSTRHGQEKPAPRKVMTPETDAMVVISSDPSRWAWGVITFRISLLAGGLTSGRQDAADNQRSDRARDRPSGRLGSLRRLRPDFSAAS